MGGSTDAFESALDPASMLLTETALLRLLGITKIPLLFFISPTVLELDDEGCAVKVPLNYRTRNHVGTLAAGADLASGLNAFRCIRKGHSKVVPLFKDLRAEFLKRADGDVVFRSRQGREVALAVERADATGERVTMPIEVVATVPERYGDEPIARFSLGLSLKRRDGAKKGAHS
jgi:hypothetical protein